MIQSIPTVLVQLLGRRFRVRSSGKEAFRIALPIMLGAVGEQVVGLLDTAFMGRVGVVELGAVGLASIWYFMLLIVGLGLGSGLQILVARRLGEKDTPAAGRAFDQTLSLTLVIGAVMYLLHWKLTPILFRYFTQSDAVYTACMTYLNYRSLDLIFVLQIFLLEGFYNGLGKNRIVVYTTIILATSNALLNFVLVFGLGSIPAMGIAGVAIASAAAHVLSWAVLWGHLFYKKYPKAFELFRTLRLRRTTTLRLLNLSAPIILQYLSGMVAFFVFLSLIEKMGETALAASNVMKAAYLFFMIPTWGFGSATSTLVSRRIGEGRKNSVWPTLWYVAQVNFLLMLVLTSSLVLFPRQVLGIFTTNAQVISATLDLLWVTVPALWGYALSGILLNALIGTGASRWTMYIEMLNACLYIGYLFVAIHFGASLQTMWMSEWIYVTMLAVLPFVLLKSGRWRRIEL